MKPTLLALRLGDTLLAVPSYGVAVTLGVAIAIVLAARQAPRADLDRGQILDLSFWLLIAGLGGSRLLFVLLNAGEFAGLCAGSGEPRGFGQVLSACAAPLRLWDGGLVFYGGGLAAALVAWRFGRRRGWRFAVVGDVYAPGLALGHAVGRLGCFFAGCCFGKTCLTGGAPCVRFPAGSVAYDHLQGHMQAAGGAAAGHTPALHPTQLYEAAALLVLFFVLTWFARRKRFHGQVLLLYVAGYALLRLPLELYRGDVNRRFLFEATFPSLARALGLPAAEPLLLSTSQLVSLLLLVAAAGAAAAVVWRRRGRQRVEHRGTETRRSEG
jgi:phosphatidylglycerol---prolipoprotein diacylglyceryl transferase